MQIFFLTDEKLKKAATHIRATAFILRKFLYPLSPLPCGLFAANLANNTQLFRTSR